MRLGLAHRVEDSSRWFGEDWTSYLKCLRMVVGMLVSLSRPMCCRCYLRSQEFLNQR